MFTGGSQVPDIILNTGDIAVNKKDKNPCPYTSWNLHFSEILKRQKKKKQTQKTLYPFLQNIVWPFNLQI